MSLIKIVDYLERINKSTDPKERKIGKELIFDLGTTCKSLYLACFNEVKRSPTPEIEQALIQSKKSLITLKDIYNKYDIYLAKRVKSAEISFKELEQVSKVLEDYGF